MLRPFFVAITISLILYLPAVGQTMQKQIRPSILKIVYKLTKENTLHLGGPVGFAAKLETNNQYYKLYQKLNKKATDEELMLLTNDNSKTVVLYSFLILYSRKYNNLKEVFINHITDTSEVWIAGGCTSSITRINIFMLRQLNPAFMDSRQPYLKQEEYDNYIKKLGITN